MEISVRADVRQARRYFEAVAKNQLPFALAKAITTTGKAIKEEEYKTMRRVFDRPTPYTMNSLFLKSATKARLEAKVWLKYDTFKGTPAEKYLFPQIAGGGRRHKRFENALIAAGVMPGGFFAVPARGADLDGYGNMRRGQIVQILAYFRAFPEAGYKANMDAKGRRRLAKTTQRKLGIRYFALGKRRGKLGPGVYMVFTGSRQVRKVITFARSVGYSKRFPYYEVADRVIGTQFKQNIDDAIEHALQSAR